MVMFSSTVRGRVLKFLTDAVPPNALEVVSVSGSEQISQCFRFHLDLISQRPDLDTSALLRQPCSLGIKQGVSLAGRERRGIQTLRFHGVLSSIEQGERHENWVAYRAVLVPRLWRLSLEIRSRIFMEKTVPRIVEEVFREAGFQPQDYEFRLSGRSYPRREYVVQYQESDLSFVSRLLEHDGIFFYFKHEDEHEKIVLGDSAAAHGAILGSETVRYGPPGVGNTPAPLGGWFGEETVHALSLRHTLVPKEVALRDYNWRTPGVELRGSASVTPDGFGTVNDFGDHFKDGDEGGALAIVRAQEWACREKIFTGTGNAKSFGAGLKYRLEDHYRADFNREYLLIEVRHRAEQSLSLGRQGSPTASYENEFVAIPFDRPFRPARVTPKPRAGSINAKIDASGSGEYAEIDEQGRYKVRFPFDSEGRGGAQASRFVRMAQPYAGSGMGMHFPLHKGTEVIVTHVNGDPDRPLIAAAVPNPETGSPVTGGNNAQCVIRTGGDNKLVIDDDVGRITLSTPTADTSISIGAEASPLGARIKSAAHFALTTGIDSVWNVGRDFKAVVVGHVHWSAVDEDKSLRGSKRELVLGAKVERVLGSKMTTIVGMETKTNLGVKNDIHMAVGLKMSNSAFVTIGPKDRDLKTVVQQKYGKCMALVAKQLLKAGEWTVKTADVASFDARLSKSRFNKWKTDVAGPWVTKTRDAAIKTAKAKWKASGDWVMETQKNLRQKASKWNADVNKAVFKAGSNIGFSAAGFAVKISGGLAKIGTKLKIRK